MDWQQVAAAGHVVAATSALAVGAVALGSPKGTQVHRALGSLYVAALVLTDAAALSLHREDVFGVFHVLAVLSLATIAVGVLPLVAGGRSPQTITVHAHCMTWSYAGLVAAGAGQLAAAGPDLGPWSVPLVVTAVLGLWGIGISRRLPQALDRVLSGPPGADPLASRWSRQVP